MKYTNDEEKEEIRIALRVFLTKSGTNLRIICLSNNLKYEGTFQKIFQGHVNSEDVDRIVKLVNPKAKLKQVGSYFTIE